MKSYDETIETVFKRIEEYDTAQKKNKKAVRSTSAPQCCENSPLNEHILNMERKTKQNSSNPAEETDYQSMEILPLKKKTWKNHFAQNLVYAGVTLAACAAILLIIWMPEKWSGTAGAENSTASTVFEESVVQTDMAPTRVSEERCKTEEATESAVTEVNYFKEMFGETVAAYTFTPAFSDSDEHVVVRAEQMLSDQANTYLVVSYEYLDEQGKEWINDYDASQILSMRPEFKDTSIFGANWSSSCATAKDSGLQQYETSAKKYFLVSCNCSTNRYSTGFVELEYPMPGILKSTTLELTKCLPGNVYEIEAELQENMCIMN